ncbi:hypothetical protein [Cupriavidus sp. D39]|uniref:hypothetical protein n=1 Tax=Cupriavidus sp. D39 TaxID=2997877 RepID=UPI00226E92E8|nr:hypothetical protein [Cupriavidus sp. D39]MCY0854316.1 hypothetical protein [Cupriavidus sp. D39]
MSATFEVGQTVVLRHDIIDPADDCHPSSLCGKGGDEVVIRYASSFGAFDWYVSHAHRTDAAFAVTSNEIEAASQAEKKGEGHE